MCNEGDGSVGDGGDGDGGDGDGGGVVRGGEGEVGLKLTVKVVEPCFRICKK